MARLNIMQSKSKVHKGSFTPAIALLMVIVILVSAITIDYSRIRFSKPLVEQHINNAINIALLDYDNDLRDNYLLFGVNDLETIKSSVHDNLNIAFQSDNTNSFYRYHINAIHVDFNGATLTNLDVLKQMIIENHSKAFALDQMVGWLEKIQAFKGLDKLTKCISGFGKIIDKISKLEDQYQKIKQYYNTFKAWQAYFSSLNIPELVKNYRSLEEDFSDITDQIENLRESVEGEILDPDSLIAHEEALDSLKSERESIEHQIDDIKSELENVIDRSKAVGELLDQFKQFNTSLDDTLKDINGLMHDISEISEKLFDGKVTKVVKGIEDNLTKFTSALSDANTNVSKQIDKLQNINNKIEYVSNNIRRFLNGEVDEIIVDSGILKDAGTIGEIIVDILSNNRTSGHSGSFIDVLKGLWEMAFNNLLKQVGYDYGTIPKDIYSQLPSKAILKKENDSYLKTKNKSQNANKMRDDIQKHSKDTSNKIMNVLHIFSTSADKLTQKMVLADYVLTYFTYNQFDEKKRESNDYIPNVETEYILYGNRSGNANVFATEASIFGLRLVMNCASLLAFKQVEINKITTEIAAMTGGFSYPVIYGLVWVGWSGIESTIDLSNLKNNKSVHFFKMKKDIAFDLSIENIINIKDVITKRKYLKDINSTSPLAMSYREYLLFFLLAKDEKVILSRILDMISISKKVDGDIFKEMQTEIVVNVEVSIKTWFSDMYKKSSSLKKDGSYHYDFTIIRGF